MNAPNLVQQAASDPRIRITAEALPAHKSNASTRQNKTMFRANALLN
jgi:hypothetical protein